MKLIDRLPEGAVRMLKGEVFEEEEEEEGRLADTMIREGKAVEAEGNEKLRGLRKALSSRGYRLVKYSVSGSDKVYGVAEKKG